MLMFEKQGKEAAAQGVIDDVKIVPQGHVVHDERPGGYAPV